ncbi:ISL3 family transposase [Gemelliphila palaticanis]
MNNYNTEIEIIKGEDITKSLLQIKDNNIQVENGHRIVKINNQKHFIFKGILTYTPEKCDCCGCDNINNTIVKNGFNELTKVNLLKISGIPAILELKKQRFKCKSCNKKFVATTPFVKKYCNISRNVVLSIMSSLADTLSFKQIAKSHDVSYTTVIRSLYGCKTQVDITNFNTLPEYLCFDEIKSTKDSKNGMSFIFSNSLTHELIDIVDGRTESILNTYFSRFSKEARFNVKAICIDIYTPYMKLIKQKFPNADIVIDRFHLIQNINRKLNSARVQLMNTYTGMNYTLFKNNWKLILEDVDNITHDKFIYNRSFKSYVTRRDILEYLLELDSVFKASYERVHDIRYAVKNRNELELIRLIDVSTNGVADSVKVAINTMRKHKDYMLNSVRYDISNGSLEGINNKVKVLKRVSYGYSSFYNFRLRILVVFRLFVSDRKFIGDLVDKKITKQQFAA